MAGQHNTEVVATPPSEPAWWTATCSCGWSGVNLRSPGHAKRDAAAHVELETGGPWACAACGSVVHRDENHSCNAY